MITVLRMNHPPKPQEFSLIDIREVWPGEAKEFTPWLAENLGTLSEHLAISQLDVEETEVVMPGGRKLDILAKDADGAKWAIENQYGQADHDHLTRALAYAVGLECRAVILVAESHREEFVAVADEWNRYSEAYGQSGIRLFLAAIEAGKIGDSDPGYRFRMVVGPNEWKSEAATRERPLSEADRVRHAERREFWSGLQEVMRHRKRTIGTIAGGDYSWVSLINKGPFNLQFAVTTKSSRVELRIESADREENNRLFDELHENREKIEVALGTTLEWVKKKEHRSNRIHWTPKGACGYRSSAPALTDGYKALADAMYKFHDALMPHIEQLV